MGVGPVSESPVNRGLCRFYSEVSVQKRKFHRLAGETCTRCRRRTRGDVR